MRGEGGVADEGRLVEVFPCMALTNTCSDWMSVALSTPTILVNIRSLSICTLGCNEA